MYLLVFITLVISLIGIYAQVLSLQASRLAQGQTTVAQAMLQWHSTALAQARYTPLTPATTTGCDFTTGGIVGIPCKDTSGNNIVVGTAAGVVSGPPYTPPYICSGTPATPPCWSILPQGYGTTSPSPPASDPSKPYTFYSVYYQTPSGQNFVLTFVPPPPQPSATNPPPGFITLPGPLLPGNVMIGITMSDLMTQIRNSGWNTMSYGTVTSSGILTTPAISNGAAVASFQYPVPATITPGSIGVISAP